MCEFHRQKLPTMCCCSESLSITANLLVAMLKVIDKSEVFDRTDGIAPFLLLDGHGSRVQLTFLEYINNPANPWSVCIGVPYGTSYWQVGDSSQQNGSFKMNIGKAKIISRFCYVQHSMFGVMPNLLLLIHFHSILFIS